MFLAKTGLTSITFDILEYVNKETAASDEEALKYHFHDIVSMETNDTPHFWSFGAAHLARMPKTPAHVLLATVEEHGKVRADFIGVLMLLVRLEEQKTDILVFINVPHVKGEYDSSDVDLQAQKLGPLLTQAEEIKQRVLQSFEIKDWSLFVTEE